MSRLIALAFFVVCAGFALDLRFLHDEGIFTFDLAASMPSAPGPLLFLIKAKALLVLLYAFPAHLGLKAFVVTHAAVAAGAILLCLGAAQRMKLANPSLAALTLAGSLGFVVAGASGFPNSDGAFFLALFLYLYAGEDKRAAALILGALPFVRYELALTSLVFLFVERKSLRFAALAFVFPILYVAAGSLYHHDPLWLIHTFSNLTQPAEVRRYQPPSPTELGLFALSSLLVNFSLLGVVGWIGWDRKLLPLFIAAAGTYVSLLLFAGLNWFGIDRSLRYHVAPLPLIALLAASWKGRATWIAAVQVAGLAAALLFSDHGRDRHLKNHELMEAVRKSPAWHGQTLLTDVQIARYDRCAGIDAWMLANDSIAYELEHYLEPEQRRRVLAALEERRFLVTLVEPRHDALYLIDPERNHRWRDQLEQAHLTGEPLGRYRLYASP